MTATTPPDLDAIGLLAKFNEGEDTVLGVEPKSLHKFVLHYETVQAIRAALSTQAETIERLKRDHAKALSDVLLAQDDAVVQRILDMPNEEILRLIPKSELDASALSGELALTKALLTVEKRRAEAAEASAAALRERVEKAERLVRTVAEANDTFEKLMGGDDGAAEDAAFDAVWRAAEACSDFVKGAPANVE